MAASKEGSLSVANFAYLYCVNITKYIIEYDMYTT